MKKLLAFGFASALIYGAAACGDTEDEIDNTLDCAEICEKRDECLTETDLTECTDFCEDKADVDPATQAAVDACEDCLDDTNCTEAAACWAKCAFVPTITGE